MNAMDCQLEQYAKDFQVLVGLHRDLEQRYEHLSSSHRQLAGAGEVLRSMSPRSQVLCLVTNLKGDVVQATNRARSLFELAGIGAGTLHRVVSMFHLPRLNAVLESQRSERMEVSDDAPEILLNPGNDVLNGHIYVTSPLVSCNDDQGKVYWVIHELNKREQSEIATDPLSARTHARRCGAVVFDAAGAILATDSGFHGMTGLDVQAIAALQLSALRSPEHASAPGADDLLTELRHTGQWQGEIGSMGPHRLAYRLWASVSAVHDADGRIVAYAAQFVDREKMLMAERFLLDAHYHDAVTGLPNRKYFKEQVAKRIAAARQDGKHVALLSIMLDRRQWIQDIHDSAVSDAVVMKMGERLLTLTRGCDILARADEDQFLLLLSGPHNDTDLGVIATQMVKALSEPVTIQHQVLQIGGSIGCAMFPQDGPDLPTLTKNAESTMRLARKAGGNRYALFKHRALPAKSDGPDPFNVPTLNMELDA